MLSSDSFPGIFIFKSRAQGLNRNWQLEAKLRWRRGARNQNTLEKVNLLSRGGSYSMKFTKAACQVPLMTVPFLMFNSNADTNPVFFPRSGKEAGALLPNNVLKLNFIWEINSPGIKPRHRSRMRSHLGWACPHKDGHPLSSKGRKSHLVGKSVGKG
jgi:hypothetical protein